MEESSKKGNTQKNEDDLRKKIMKMEKLKNGEIVKGKCEKKIMSKIFPSMMQDKFPEKYMYDTLC